jgi:hypothetical protein
LNASEVRKVIVPDSVFLSSTIFLNFRIVFQVKKYITLFFVRLFNTIAYFVIMRHE